jgi:hypothetical protein
VAPNLPRSAVLAACADMIRACGLTLEELAAHLHDPSAPAVHVVVRPPAVRALSDNDRRVIEAAGAAEGVTVSGVIDLLGLRDAQAHRYCAILTQAGHLTGVKKPGIRAMHYFSSPASAQAWANDTAATVAPSAAPAPKPPAVKMKRVKPGRPGVELLKKGGTVSPPAPPMPKATAEPIFTDKTIRTIDDKRRPTARWQMQQEAPDERWPSFAAVPPGVDPATGKAWEQRA